MGAACEVAQMQWDSTTALALPSTEVTQLHLFRHGEVDTGGVRRAYGHTDYPLTARGQDQGRSLVDFAQRRLPPADGVISSDLARCTAIARPLAERLGVPLLTSPLLREQHMGDWEGRAWDALSEADIAFVREYWSHYATVRPPGGETYSEMAFRVTGWLEAEWAQLRGRRWHVLTHIGPIRAFCCRLLGVPLDQALRFTPLYCSHTWYQLAQAGPVLQALGERTGAIALGPATVARAEVRPSMPAGRPPRIALSGSAGTGKTTLGRALAARFGVPYIPEGMRARIEAGLVIHDLGHEGLQTLIVELLEEQLAAEAEALATAGGFVADRSPVDYAAFWLHYQFSHDRDATERFLARCLQSVRSYDRIVVLPWGVLPLEADGVRSTNPWLQRSYQAILEGLVRREVGPPGAAWLPERLDALEQRVDWVVDLLTEAGGLATAE